MVEGAGKSDKVDKVRLRPATNNDIDMDPNSGAPDVSEVSIDDFVA